MSHAASARRGTFRLAAALSLITLVLGHQLVYLATYGAQTSVELARTGHDLQWSVTVASVALLAFALAAFALRELLRLTRQARPAAGLVIDPRISGARHLMRDMFVLWVPTFIVAAALFVLVENTERLVARLPAPGLTVLSASTFHDPLLIFELLSGAVAFVAALWRWRRDILVERIRVLARRWPRPHALFVRPADDAPIRPSALTLRPPGRAPPLLAEI
jgi:hypothetical protein